MARLTFEAAKNGHVHDVASETVAVRGSLIEFIQFVVVECRDNSSFFAVKVCTCLDP
jgi:hypothetical protein